MRTTIDLPDELHRIALSIARDRSVTLSEAVAHLLRLALGSASTAEVSPSPRTGVAVIRLGHTITSEDVRALDDES